MVLKTAPRPAAHAGRPRHRGNPGGDAGIGRVEAFVNNGLDRRAPLRSVEQDQVTDLTQPLSIAREILAIVLDFFG
jgi:hypothetical protein